MTALAKHTAALQEPTRLAIEQALHQYKAAGRTSLTVLVLGTLANLFYASGCIIEKDCIRRITRVAPRQSICRQDGHDQQHAWRDRS